MLFPVWTIFLYHNIMATFLSLWFIVSYIHYSLPWKISVVSPLQLFLTEFQQRDTGASRRPPLRLSYPRHSYGSRWRPSARAIRELSGFPQRRRYEERFHHWSSRQMPHLCSPGVSCAASGGLREAPHSALQCCLGRNGARLVQSSKICQVIQKG